MFEYISCHYQVYLPSGWIKNSIQYISCQHQVHPPGGISNAWMVDWRRRLTVDAILWIHQQAVLFHSTRRVRANICSREPRLIWYYIVIQIVGHCSGIMWSSIVISRIVSINDLQTIDFFFAAHKLCNVAPHHLYQIRFLKTHLFNLNFNSWFSLSI